jgi:hypothetical protein
MAHGSCYSHHTGFGHILSLDAISMFAPKWCLEQIFSLIFFKEPTQWFLVEKSSRFFWARHQCYQDTDFGIRALMMPLHFWRLLVDMPLMQTFSAIMQYADHATNALLTPSRQSYFCLLCEHYFWYACFPPLWSSCFLGVRCFLCYTFYSISLNFTFLALVEFYVPIKAKCCWA